MEDFKYQVKKGFERCKLDIEDVKFDSSKLKSELNSVKEENSMLKSELGELKAELKGLKIAIDYIKEMKVTPAQAAAPVSQVVEQPVAAPVAKVQKDPYEALLAFKAKANKREVLKQKMMTMVGENGVHKSELKFLFVDHYKYCSKATFYNYLKELELYSAIKIERVGGKDFVYLTHLISNEI